MTSLAAFHATSCSWARWRTGAGGRVAREWKFLRHLAAQDVGGMRFSGRRRPHGDAAPMPCSAIGCGGRALRAMPDRRSLGRHQRKPLRCGFPGVRFSVGACRLVSPLAISQLLHPGDSLEAQRPLGVWHQGDRRARAELNVSQQFDRQQGTPATGTSPAPRSPSRRTPTCSLPRSSPQDCSRY